MYYTCTCIYCTCTVAGCSKTYQPIHSKKVHHLGRRNFGRKDFDGGRTQSEFGADFLGGKFLLNKIDDLRCVGINQLLTLQKWEERVWGEIHVYICPGMNINACLKKQHIHVHCNRLAQIRQKLNASNESLASIHVHVGAHASTHCRTRYSGQWSAHEYWQRARGCLHHHILVSHLEFTSSPLTWGMMVEYHTLGPEHS